MTQVLARCGECKRVAFQIIGFPQKKRGESGRVGAIKSRRPQKACGEVLGD